MTPADLPTFTEFYRAVHDRDPFPWQAALADRILAGQDWPEAVNVPTGLGKTSLLDIALYTAAAGAPDRRRRVFFIVDRRLVVDEAFDHATTLAETLNGTRTPQDPSAAAVVEKVAARLHQPEHEGPVVQATRMRGGTTWSWQWIDRPDRHALTVGTVDQIGSRLFLRGYGVSDRLRPIDAAMVGTDSLILVDEAHLSQAMLTSIATASADQPDHVLARPRVVQMSATVTHQGPGRAHSIDEADRHHPLASLRLSTPRRMHLVEPDKVTKTNAEQRICAQLAGWAQALAAAQPVNGPVVLVVCNTVARARTVFTHLAEGGVDEEQRVLLIGRSRPVDRRRLMDTFYERIHVDREHGREHQPLYAVATQTVEVGANIDADVLVSESASISALIQRMGRLARAPEKRRTADTTGAWGWHAPAVIVHDPSTKDGDPVYGQTRQGTWDFLTRLAEPLTVKARQPFLVEALGQGIEASPTALDRLLEQATDAERAAYTQVPQAPPVLHPGVLRSWEHTSPSPVTDPPVAPFLHGLETRDRDVTLLWRDDIDPATCTDPDTGAVATHVLKQLRSVPPSSDEQLQIPLTALRRWRNHHTAAGQVTDLETGAAEEAEEVTHQEYVLRYHSRDEIERITLNQVRPGDSLILPAHLGGCDQYGWAPDSTRTVADVADSAARRGYPIVRIDQRLIDTVGLVDGTDTSTPARALHSAVEELVLVHADSADQERVPEPDDYRTALAQVRAALADDGRRHPVATNLILLAHACDNRALRVAVDDTATGTVVLSAGRHLYGSDSDEASSAATTQSEPVWLEEHQDQVARQAAAFARNIGLPDQQVHAVYLAGLYHDEGKRDPRFQALLRGGLALPATQASQGRALAKSLTAPTDPSERERVLQNSGYPRGMRHEGLSARISQHHLHIQELDPDLRDLVLHLVASHHGHARPLLPPVPDLDPVRVPIPHTDTSVNTADLLDWDSPARFARLNRTHGRWKLALLEAVVRMADMWCSAGRTVTTSEHTPPEPTHRRRREPDRVVHTVALPALDGRDALGFLASLGVLRLLHQQLGPDRVRLSFDPYRATTQITSPLRDAEEIGDALQRIVENMPSEAVLPQVRPGWPPQIGVGEDPLRVPRTDLSALAERARHHGGEHAPMWLHAIVTDLADDKGRVALTPLMAPAGGQKAATFFSKPLDLVWKVPESLHQALTGWQRLDGCTGENLDHRAIRTAVDTPTGVSTPNGVPGATWLATQALPMLDLSGQGRRVRSALWYRHQRRRIMLWPVWKHPLDLEGVRTLITHPSLQPQATDGPEPRLDRKDLVPLGVLTVAAACRRPIPGGKSAGVLTPMPVDVV